mmetsp:Transcript_8175/g.14159  ORF Transcript_8175/g.14159 Transcript_8175/m.14159 type:complete len:98 (-) Transcript_8175:708-1001(-)
MAPQREPMFLPRDSEETVKPLGIEEAEVFARSIREKMRSGIELTVEDRKKMIQLALQFADPEKVVAVERSAAHVQSRITARQRKPVSSLEQLVECES